MAEGEPYAEVGCSTAVVRLSGGFVADPSKQSVPLRMQRCEEEAKAAEAEAKAAEAEAKAAEAEAKAVAGTCAETEFGGDCASDSQGAWAMRGALSDCVRRCRCCARCRYVSYSRHNSDCSWFASCDLAALKTDGQAASYRTVPVQS